jgi:hypothetical protein
VNLGIRCPATVTEPYWLGLTEIGEKGKQIGNVSAAWRTYTPDGRELAVEHEGGRWTANCNGRRSEGSSALEAIAGAVGHEEASIGILEVRLAAWIRTEAAQLESEAD